MFLLSSLRTTVYHLLPTLPMYHTMCPRGHTFALGHGGCRKNIWGAWSLIAWEATTAKRNYYRTNSFFGGGQDLGACAPT